MGMSASSTNTCRAGKYHFHDERHYGEAARGGDFGKKFRELAKSVNVDRNVKEFSRFWRNGGSLLDILPNNNNSKVSHGGSGKMRLRRVAAARRNAARAKLVRSS